MTRRLKALGLALAALAAIGVAGAQGASATVVEHEFQSASNPTILKGTDETGSNHTFTVGGFATVECEVAHFTGTSTGTEVDTIAMHPTYTGCGFFGEEMTFDTTGCVYLLDSDTSDGHADLEVSCSGTGMEVESAACTIWFGDQTTDPGVSYANVAKGDITAAFTVPDLEAHAWEGPLCDLLVNEGTITYRMEGLLLIEGFTDPGEVATNIAVGATP